MKLALVIPWFGRELKGGAEQHAWQIAARLAARDHEIEVLTTCCRSHQDDWETNHFLTGLTTETEGFAVRRFPVVARDREQFERVAAVLQNVPTETLRAGVSPVSPSESGVFVEDLIKSPELVDFIRQNANAYDRFIFLPYLYGPVIHGVGIVGDRAALVPCLHDEAYAYLPQIAETFARAGLLLFNSEGEQELALRLFGPGIWRKSRLVGGGIEPTETARLDARQELPKHERFVLYLGRKDPGKNVPMLLRAFARFRRVRPNSDLRLLLAGHGDANVNGSKHAIDLGLISDADKDRLLDDCLALFQPSQNESFSRVLMEAWMHGKPVAAHASCLATAVAVQHSAGGWIAESEDDWARLFTEVDRTSSEVLRELGENGRRYAEELADWDLAITRYEAALKEDAAPEDVAVSATTKQHAIHQVLPNLAYGDAISNHAIWIRDELRRLGFHSEVFAHAIHSRMAEEGSSFSPAAIRQADALIYHHSIGSEVTPHTLRFDGPKCLVYHNITPAEFFDPFWPHYADLVRRGRRDLSGLAQQFTVSAGVSEYNMKELRTCGFRDPFILPIGVDPARWRATADEELMAELQDGRTNILFVGRIAPNKKQDDLVVAFAEYLQLDPDARLFLVGKAEENDPYPLHLQNTIRDLGLADRVIVAGSVDEAELIAYWRTATLFWSMSEHEGFCVPLVEAMWFDVPVIAFHSSAVPETLGDAGLLFTDKTDLDQVAALAHLAATDPELRRKMIDAQRRQRMKFLPETARSSLHALVARLTSDRFSELGNAPQRELPRAVSV